MRVEPLGEWAVILRDLSEPAYELADAINLARLPGVIEAAASYDTVGVYLDDKAPPPDIRELVLGLRRVSVPPRALVIPVCYEMGEDVAHVAATLRTDVAGIARMHSAPVYRCYAVGFCPGFPYLGWLPSELQGLPRLGRPRTRVEPGSVGITGRQTGIYPLERPGGWLLIGRTPLTLIDEDFDYYPIRAGDNVRFQPITESEFESLHGRRL